ncbi:hypothetical protein AVEN_258636-1 [Araneus ventricosus]|uniref:Uncharacterized protein n=1 Tax=Araneus ventricosus TaxID=182803 RepID=A0A4Y2HN28_ARAVE|nr:hypothetical protein AVEN_258636-1 [Araneus ventricosus]
MTRRRKVEGLNAAPHIQVGKKCRNMNWCTALGSHEEDRSLIDEEIKKDLRMRFGGFPLIDKGGMLSYLVQLAGKLKAREAGKHLCFR